MALTDDLSLTSKFRGCLLGSVMGDCLGFPYEEKPRPTPEALQKFFDELEFSSHKGLSKSSSTILTDVTVHVIDVFEKLQETKCKDPCGPAREQFDGNGSYGNGGAMRIAPVALFYQGQGTETLGSMAQRVTVITHTHPEGINGAILQCLAIEQCLLLNPAQPVDASAFLKELITKMQMFEDGSRDEFLRSCEETQPFTSRLLWAIELLEKEKSGSKKINDDEDVLARLGSDVAALTSVPTAIFCFLRAHQGDIPLIKTDNPLRRTLQYAISLGGDTDTIGGMAGALSGALLGYQPKYFHKMVVKRCEGAENALRLADKLYDSSRGRLERMCSLL